MTLEHSELTETFKEVENRSITSSFPCIETCQAHFMILKIPPRESFKKLHMKCEQPNYSFPQHNTYQDVALLLFFLTVLAIALQISIFLLLLLWLLLEGLLLLLLLLLLLGLFMLLLLPPALAELLP